MNGWQIGLLLLATIVLAFVGGRCSKTDDSIGRDTVETVRLDTVQLERIVYRNLPARHDTVYLQAETTWGDTNRTFGVVHSIDTVFAGHNDSLRVEYLEPEGVFNLDFRPGPRVIEVRDTIIYVPKPYAVEIPSIPWIIGGVAVGFAFGLWVAQ